MNSLLMNIIKMTTCTLYLESCMQIVLTMPPMGRICTLFIQDLLDCTWAKFSLVWLSLVFGWALFRTINVDQRGGKTESERYQRLLAMTI